jgi:toxin HigB-1
MIVSYRSKTLKRFALTGNYKGLSVQKPLRIAQILKALDAATRPDALDLPGLRFHRLKGNPIRYTVWASENWRITFGWDGADAVEVDMEDYH